MIINKVIFSWQDPDDMEEINTITTIDPFRECNCCDYSNFEQYPQLKKFISDEELQALKNGDADYIAFRIDY